MGLSNDLISQFVKVTKDDRKTANETTVYGKIKVVDDDSKYIILDGDEKEQNPIPLSNQQLAVTVANGNRVRATIKNHNLVVTGNVNDPSASTTDIKNTNDRISDFDSIVADKISTDEFYAERARIDALAAEDIVIKNRLSANEADIVTLEAENVTINEKLKVNEADISNLKADKLDANTAAITYATIEDLDAAEADIYNLRSTYGEFVNLTTENFKAVDADIEYLKANKVDAADADIIRADISDLNADVADINTLMFGSATGDVLQTSFSNSVIAQLGDAQIKSAMIESVAASKITAGDIITNNVRVKSEDGSLLISDETMQISDDTQVRVQIGKDASGDYSINIWDQNGNLMFSKGGITDSAIKDAIIRNDMVSDTANIAAHKLDIDSLFDEINGSSKTIKSTKVYLDEEGQTLNVAFKSLTEDVGELGSTVSSQGTQITAVQGQISSKIWQQDINTAVDNIEIGGRNLYIVKNSEEGFLTVGNETLAEMNSTRQEHTSEFIPVKEGEEYVFQVWVTVDPADTADYNLWMAYDFFNSDKNTMTDRPSKRSLNALPNGQCYDIFYITTPANAKYIRVSARLYSDGRIKLERGNKATDWTLAPEDTEKDIEKLSTQYSSIEQTVNSISTTVASHESTIANKADSSTVTSVSNKVTSLEQDLNGFKTTVSDTYSTKTELENVDDKVDSVTSRMSSAETTISQQSTAIGLCATKTDVDNTLKNYSTTSQMNAAIQLSANSIESTVSSKYATKETVDNIEIGGRNLYIVKNAVDGYLSSSGDGSITAASTITKEKTSDFIPVEPGDEIIFQVWATTPDSSYIWYGYQFFGEDKAAIDTNRPAEHLYDMTGGACHATYDTITVPSSASYIRVSARMFDDGKIKVEKGNKPTDWTPAPEDVEGDISALDVRMTTVEQTADGLTVRMTSAETGITNAAKTATNYINASTSGLVVGDMTASTLGQNVRISSSTVDIREGTTTLASFGANTIYLGKNSETAVINLCNGSATMRSVDDTNFQIYTDKRLVMKAYDTLLLDCWRDSTHQTRISMQSADPDASYIWGGISAWLYQDTIENTFDMSGNTTQFKITDGTNEAIVDLDETRLRVQANSTQINCTNGLYVGYDGSYAAKITLGYQYLQDKAIRWYWSDNALHDAFSNANGQITYVGPGDIDETTTTMIRGQYVRLYAHSGGAVYLGYSGSTAVTSDRNMKTDILDVDDKYMDFFDRLRPITYKYDCPGNKGHRDHVGFIAQEVEEALIASGLTTEEFAGLIIEQDVTLNPDYDSSMTDEEKQSNEVHYDTLYSLRYEEFISLLVKKVQSLQEQINQLRAV